MSQDAVVHRLDEILDQVRATNGRVTALERDMGDVHDVLYGDKERLTPGLVRQSKDVDHLLRQWSALMKVGKGIAGALGAVAVALTVNIVGGLL